MERARDFVLKRRMVRLKRISVRFCVSSVLWIHTYRDKFLLETILTKLPASLAFDGMAFIMVVDKSLGSSPKSESLPPSSKSESLLKTAPPQEKGRRLMGSELRVKSESLKARKK